MIDPEQQRYPTITEIIQATILQYAGCELPLDGFLNLIASYVMETKRDTFSYSSFERVIAEKFPGLVHRSPNGGTLYISADVYDSGGASGFNAATANAPYTGPNYNAGGHRSWTHDYGAPDESTIHNR